MTTFDAFWNSSAVQDFPGAVYLRQTILYREMMPGTHFVSSGWQTGRGKLVETMRAGAGTQHHGVYVCNKRALEQQGRPT